MEDKKTKEYDGGYYALKGFNYQFDKTITEILSKDVNVYFEYIEDINSENEIIQVKLFENRTYRKSLIKKPILNLYDNFINNNKGIIPILFGYVENNKKTEAEIKKDVKDILDENKKTNYSEFLENLIIDLDKKNSKEKQYNNIIEKIKEEFFVNTTELAENYYIQIIGLILNKIVNNKEKEKRFLNKTNLISKLKQNNKICFNQLFCEYKGEEKYIKNIKKEYFYETNKSNYERLFIIDLCNCDFNELFNLIDSIIKKYNQHIDFENRKKQYNRYIAINKSTYYSPYVYLKNIDNTILLNIKNKLIVEKPYYIIDGFKFQNSDFNEEYFFDDNPFCNLKFINNKDVLEKFLSWKFNKIKKIYYFYQKENIYKDRNDIVPIYVSSLDFINKII